MSFPVSPVNGQYVVVNNITYQFDSAKSAWIRVLSAADFLTVNNLSVVKSLSGNISGGNVYATGFYWATNNEPFTSSLYSNTNVAAYLAGNVTTGNISSTGYFWANGQPFLSSGYGDPNVAAYLTTATISTTGNITANNITANGNIVGGGVRNSVGSTPPANPVPGDTWYDTDNDVLLRYVNDGDSNQWVDISSVVVASLGGGYRYTIAATPPTTATPGDNWYDTTTDILFRYVTDGTSSYWVDNSSIGLEVQSFTIANVVTYLSGNITSGNISATGFYWANGAPFVSSTYSNANVTAYLPGDATITSLQSNAASQSVEIADLRSNITAANGAIITANTGMKNYVDGQITTLINSAPTVLDTLGEIAAALGNDANLSVTLTNLIGNVQANVTGANAAIVTANTNLQNYVDAQISVVNANVTAANGSIITANTGMKSYVDARTYSNVNTAAYLAGNITIGNVFTNGLYYANGTPFSTGGTSTSAYMLSYIFGA